jgi:Uma2 family endonuclease
MSITLKHSRPMTDDELLELSRLNPGYQFERDAKGELVVTPTGSESGRREFELTAQLHAWSKRDGRGIGFSPSTGFRLPDGGVYAPDAAWVHRERWDALSKDQRQKFAPLCPDAVFEIQSENQSTAELREKMHLYLTNGAQVAVLINPDGRTVEVYRSGRSPEIRKDPETVALDPELPGLMLDLEPIFAR